MEKKIKVLQMCAVGFTVEKMLLPLIDEMSRQYDVTIVCSRDEISDTLKKRGYQIKNIDIDRSIKPVSNFLSLIKLYRFIKTEKFHVVHVHTPIAGILGRIAAKMAAVPVVIYTAHGFYFHDNMSLFKKKLYVLLEKIGGHFSDYIFTQSTEDYHAALDKKIISKERITAIGNGVDIQKFNAGNIENNIALKLRKEFDIKEDEVVVGIIGRVVKEKGYFEWVRAAKRISDLLDNIKFIAVGDTLESDRDGIKKELDEFIEQNNLRDKIFFAGSREDIPELLSIMDIFTLPSYREGMPRSLIEAMSMSIVAIATDIRGCREEIVEGETGFLVPVGDSDSLAEKICYLAGNTEKRIDMGVKARQRVERQFDERKVIGKQMNIIESLILEAGK